MEFRYRLRKHAMIIHIHQPDTVRADQGLPPHSRHPASVVPRYRLRVSPSPKPAEITIKLLPPLPGQHFHHLGARFTRNRDDRQLRLRDIMYRRIRLDALHVCLLGVYHIILLYIFPSNGFRTIRPPGLCTLLEPPHHYDALRINQFSVNHNILIS